MTQEERRKELLRVWGPIIGICVVALLGTYLLFVEPPPPSRIVLSAGAEEGSYFAFAQRYREILAESGIDLEVRPSAGSTENVARLRDPASGVQVAFVQSGLIDEQAGSGLMALGSIYREPLWVFYRAEKEVLQLTELKGKRIAVGAAGSGTRAVALRLLADNGLKHQKDGTTFVEMDSSEAVEALQGQTIEVAFFVVGPKAEYLRTLLTTDGVRLMDFRRAESYVRHYSAFSSVKISEGLLDLRRNLPSKPVTLIAPTATLVARQDLHPALVPLIVETAGKVHKKGSLIDAAGEFPSPSYVDVELSPDAARYLKSGPSLLNRYLPFWVASLADRLKFMLVPLLTLLLPLLRVAPPLYRWRISSKIHRWYEQLRAIDLKPRSALTEQELAELREQIAELEEDLSQGSVPASYLKDYYNLRLHLSHVQARLLASAPQADEPGEGKDEDGEGEDEDGQPEAGAKLADEDAVEEA